MIANIHQRLKRLEARVKPTDEPEEFVIEFIGPEKEIVRTLIIRGTDKNGQYSTAQGSGTKVGVRFGL
jgi:hypothetical protein